MLSKIEKTVDGVQAMGINNINSLISNLGWAWSSLVFGLIATVLLSLIGYNIININGYIKKKIQSKTKALEEATQKALLANQAKSRFLANVSHEIRTPLNMILGMADLLSQTEINERQREYIETFHRSGSHLLDIISDILDLTNIEAGEIPKNEVETHLPELLEGLSDAIIPACRTKNIEFEYIISVHFPEKVRVDPKRLRQIIINLLNNAVKFTENGHISLIASFNFDTQNLVVSVKDTGIGINLEEKNKIFDEFYQINSTSKRAKGGVGLGLSIVKTYVKLLDGNIDLKSELNVGSEFTITIPCSKVSGGWLEKIKDSQLMFNKTIFLYSVSEYKIQFLSNCFNYVNAQVKTSNSLKECQAMIREFSHEYEFILMDISDNLVSLEKLMYNFNLDPALQCKIIILCPLLHQNGEEAFLQKFGHYKTCYIPIRFKVLVSLLLDIPYKEDKSSKIKDVILPRGLKIIIAEDDEDNRYLLKAYLAQHSIDVWFAENGKEALNIYYRYPKQWDLIITDIQMPIMDGHELILEIRKHESIYKHKKVPIIIITADAQLEQSSKVEEIGADGYLTKPISMNNFISAIKAYTTTQRQN